MGREENGNLAVYEECVRELADKHMKRRVVRYVDTRTDLKIEPMWITSDIKKGISKRRYFNKLVRKGSENPDQVAENKELYLRQKD